MEWASVVTHYGIYNSSNSIQKHDPEHLPTIDVSNGKNRRRYKDGKLHNLKRCALNFYSQLDLGFKAANNKHLICRQKEHIYIYIYIYIYRNT